MRFSNTKVTSDDRSFINDRGETAPGLIPKILSKSAGFANENLTAPSCWAVIFRSMTVSSKVVINQYLLNLSFKKRFFE